MLIILRMKCNDISLLCACSLLRRAVVRRIAMRTNKTPAQILYRFVRSQGIVPLSGTTSQEHMLQDLEVEGIDIDSGEVNDIATLLYA